VAHKSLWTDSGGTVLESLHVTGRDAIGACKVMGLAGSETTPLALRFFGLWSIAEGALRLVLLIELVDRQLDKLRIIEP
jgi:hypothetical protein